MLNYLWALSLIHIEMCIRDRETVEYGQPLFRIR